MRCREGRTSFSEGADWPQDPGLDGPNTLCNAGLRPSPTTELLLLCASAWQWSTPSSLQQPHRPTRAALAQPGPAALASVGAPALWLVRERNSAAPRSGRPSAPASFVRSFVRCRREHASPSSRRKVKLCSDTLNLPCLALWRKSTRLTPPCAAHPLSGLSASAGVRRPAAPSGTGDGNTCWRRRREEKQFGGR